MISANLENSTPWVGNALDKVITPAQKKGIRQILSLGGGADGSEALALRQWIGKRVPITVIDLQPCTQVAAHFYDQNRIRHIEGDWYDEITREGARLLQEADLIVSRHPPIEGGTPATVVHEGEFKPALEVKIANPKFFNGLIGVAKVISDTRCSVTQHLVISTWNSMPDTLLRTALSREQIPAERVLFNGGKSHLLNIHDIPSKVQLDRYLLHVQSAR